MALTQPINYEQHDPDVRLMLRAKEGDETAFTQLVTNYQDRLVGVLSHMLQSKETAEDIAQEVFIRVYKARHGYQPTAKFATWLFRIANNLANNLRRDAGRRKEVLLNVNDSGPLGPRPAERMIADKSGLMPARPFRIAESVLRLVPIAAPIPQTTSPSATMFTAVTSITPPISAHDSVPRLTT